MPDTFFYRTKEMKEREREREREREEKKKSETDTEISASSLEPGLGLGVRKGVDPHPQLKLSNCVTKGGEREEMREFCAPRILGNERVSRRFEMSRFRRAGHATLRATLRATNGVSAVGSMNGGTRE